MEILAMVTRRQLETALTVVPVAMLLAMIMGCQAAAQTTGSVAPTAGNIVLNGGFEEEGSPARGWAQDLGKTGNKGRIARDTTRNRSGPASLRMQPNGNNAPPDQLSVAQELQLSPYRGKSVVLSATMQTEGEARALAGLIVVGRGGPKLLQLDQVAGSSGWKTETRTFDLPDDASARYFLALWVDGRSGTAWFDDVSVTPPGTTRAAPVASAAAVTATNGGPYDAWNPPLGDAVQNLTMAEGWTDARLVAAPVNVAGNGGWTDSVTASRDGKRLYFGYTKWDYFIFESTQKFVPKGAERTAGYSGNDLQIYQADLSPSGWSVSRHPANPGPDISAASMGLNGTEDLMVYNSYQFTPKYSTTMRMATKAGNAWTQRGAIPAPINSPAGCLDDNGFIVGSLSAGATLYFESTRAALNGSTCGKDRHLYSANYQGGAWSGVKAVAGVNSNAAGDNDMQPYLSEDQARIYWQGSRPSQGKYGLFTADWNGREYANARMIIGIRTFTAPWANKVVRIGEPNVVVLPQGSVMYFMCGIALGDTSRGAPDNIQYRVCFARKPN
jgi:hypothetical protein